MKLTDRTDYALRVLIYLAVRQEEPGLPSRDDAAEAYGISADHVAKIVADLSNHGFVETVRGRGGGMRLGAPPDEISIGEVVRKMEPHFALVECMSEQSECPIDGVCALYDLLDRARADFLETLDAFTLADIVSREAPLRRRLGLTGS